MDITNIFNGVIYIITCAVGIIIIKMIGKNIPTQERKELVEWAKIAVAAAEQLYYHFDGPTKKEYVLEFLAKQGFDVDTDEVDAVIEAEVLELHSTLYGWVEGTAELQPGIEITEEVKPNE